MAPIKLCDRETQAQIRFEADTFRLVKVGWFTALGTVSNYAPLRYRCGNGLVHSTVVEN